MCSLSETVCGFRSRRPARVPRWRARASIRRGSFAAASGNSNREWPPRKRGENRFTPPREETPLEPTLAWTADASTLCALAGSLPSTPPTQLPEDAVLSLPIELLRFAQSEEAAAKAEDDDEVLDDEQESDDSSDGEDDEYDEDDDYDGDRRPGRRSRDDERDRHSARGKRRRHGHGSDRVRGRGTRRVID